MQAGRFLLIQHNLYLVLDLHSAPGGQTGANIDDSFGYPFLYESSYYTDMTINLWKTIA
jgi:endoglucanase